MPLFRQVVIKGNYKYLEDFLECMLIPTSVYAEVATLWHKEELPTRKATAGGFRVRSASITAATNF